MNIVALLIAWVVTAVSLYIISKLPFLGVEIDTPGKAFISAAALGIVNVLVRPVLGLFAKAVNFLTFDLLSGLITFIVTVICFGLAAWLVQGFRLRFGFWSAILGALALSVISGLIYKVLGV